MNVILLDKVEYLGDIGYLVTGKPGYGRSCLLPSGKASLATPENIAEFEARRSDLENHAAEQSLLFSGPSAGSESCRPVKPRLSACSRTDQKVSSDSGSPVAGSTVMVCRSA